MPVLRMCVAVPILISVAALSYGCDDNGSTSVLSNGVGPSALADAPFVSRGGMVRPSTVDVQRVLNPACPARPPLLAPFSIAFDGDGRSDVFLRDVQMQFVDSAGIRAGTMTLGPADLAARFGSTTLPAIGTRVFPFAFPFGCTGLPSGTLTIVVLAGDTRGRESRTVAHLPVR